ncbi:hypothetical protein O7632_06500 [Solwaraspora sp. WMMD406]|uniref:hypothetical protein n=1 Tax=Solwaraspora sp. WMMD406 TaxID=3016095 RepID=UPI00241619F4|nr:hypothetical protein [Solwaraspora sp. WMMD406]MDG4763761.1 hypothetical protein [Solwaraspora sp. WMMD406]
MRRLLDVFRTPVRSRRHRRLLAEIGHHSRNNAAAAAAGSRRPPTWRSPNAGAHYNTGSAARLSISPVQVRDRYFPDRARRGCDPGEVRAYLYLVADELAALRADLAATSDENVRIKQALRDWQSQQFRAQVPA